MYSETGVDYDDAKTRTEEMHGKSDWLQIPAKGEEVVDMKTSLDDDKKKESPDFESARKSTIARQRSEEQNKDLLPTQWEFNVAFNDFPPRTLESNKSQSRSIETDGSVTAVA